MEKCCIVADVGGTHARFAFLDVSDDRCDIVYRKDYETDAWKSFRAMVSDFLSEVAGKYETVVYYGVFCGAGKVEQGRIKLTNAALTIDSNELKRKTSLLHVELLNDFFALSYGIERLSKKDMDVLNPTKRKGQQPMAVLGAGTGLGEAMLIYNHAIKSYEASATEGGHVDFPVHNEEDISLLRFLFEQTGRRRIVYEDVLSGRGLEHLYTFLARGNTEGYLEALPAEEISSQRRRNPYARDAFRMFYRYYGRAAKNLALQSLAGGGIYLAGGIVEKNLPVTKQEFMREFLASDTFKEFLSSIPVAVIKNKDVSLYGLGNYFIKQEKRRHSIRTPHLAVDGIIEYQGKEQNGIVLIERKHAPHGWALPGGFVHYRESAMQALRREMKEETNLSITYPQVFDIFSDPSRDPRRHVVSMTYEMKGRGTLKAKDDAKEIKVVKPIDALQYDLAFDHAKIIREYIKRKGL